MKYRLLGKSGLRVSEVALGAATFGEDWGFGSSKEESKKVFDTFIEAGGNFIDTANKYNDGTSESYLGEFISSEREKVIVSTKYSLSTSNNINSNGNHRKNMVHSLEESLKRLKTDYIDIFWVHIWDFITPIEEVMRALDDLVRAGKILYVGISDSPAWVVSKANTIADMRGWTPFIGLQTEYSLINRDSERELIPMAKNLDIGVLSWSPLGGGILTGKYDKNNIDATDSKRIDRNKKINRITERNFTIAEEVKKISEETGYSCSQIALNWVRQRDGIIPIIGARTEAQLKENLLCLKFELSNEHMNRLNEVSKIELGFPYDFANNDLIKKLIYGDTFNLIKFNK